MDDGAGNAVGENSSIFSLIQMHSLRTARVCMQSNFAVLIFHPVEGRRLSWPGWLVI